MKPIVCALLMPRFSFTRHYEILLDTPWPLYYPVNRKV